MADIRLTQIVRQVVGASVGTEIRLTQIVRQVIGAYQCTPTTGTIIVIKETHPDGDATVFDVIASGGLSPDFTISDGQSVSFTGLTAGSGFSIVETANPLYNTLYTVSNGSPNTNILVEPGEIVTVTIINTLASLRVGGIYQLVPDKTNDTLYVDNIGNTVVVKIPDPFADTCELEGEE